MKGIPRRVNVDDAPPDRDARGATARTRSLWSEREVEAFLVRAAESIAHAATARAPDYVRRVNVEGRDLVLAEWECEEPTPASDADTTGSATTAPPSPGRKTPWH